MFGNLKEYQDLKKLYEEKVSKPEDIQEFKSKFSKPAAPVKSPMEAGMGSGAAKAREMAKARIAAKKTASQPKSTPSVDSFKQGMKTPLNVSDTKKPEGAKVDTSSEIESSSAEFKANEGDKFNKNFNKQNAKPTFQKNRDKLNQSRQNQNKDRFKKQVSGVTGAIKSFADRFKAKPIERKEGQTSVRQKSNVKTKPTTAEMRNEIRAKAGKDAANNIPKKGDNTGTDTQGTKKQIPQRNTGTDTQGTRKEIPQRNTGTDTETKTNKITPKPNTGTDTETKTSTSSSSASDKIKAFRDKKRNLQTRAKYGSNATIETQDGKSFKPGDPGYEAELKKAKELMRNSMKKEEYEPYDIVLEYLLSTEQVATIEEANYVMTEMDGETIRSVVKEFLGGQKGDGYIGHPRLGVENPLSPPKKNTKKTDSSKGLFKSLGNRATDLENKINKINNP